MEKWVTCPCNPPVLAPQEIFAITMEGVGGGGSRCLPFLGPPFEKDSIFKVKVTGLLLWHGAEPLEAPGGRGRDFPTKACPSPQLRAVAALGQGQVRGWKSSFKGGRFSGTRGIPGVGREGRVDSKTASVVLKDWKSQGQHILGKPHRDQNRRTETNR